MEDKRDLIRACLELASVSAGITKVLAELARDVPRKPPASERKVVVIRKAVGE